MSRPKQKWDEINIRKGERYAKIGLEMESKIAEFLQGAKDSEGKPVFEQVIHHKRFSTDDRRGRDITVCLKKNGRIQRQSFGVTTSLRRFHQTDGLHKAPVFFTPVDYNPGHLLEKILNLFD